MGMDSPIHRQSAYDTAKATIDEVVSSRVTHEAEGPCGAEPLCCGPLTQELVLIRKLDPDRYSILLLTSIGELAEQRRIVADRELRIYRLRNELATAREQLAAAEIRLAEWNAGADAVYPASPA